VIAVIYISLHLIDDNRFAVIKVNTAIAQEMELFI